ncbi:hypothetical protein E2320_014792, partial [Naja naja]
CLAVKTGIKQAALARTSHSEQVLDTLAAYPCGSDHTPSPMASRVPLEAVPVLEKSDARLTAVAASIEDGHTVVFLGDSQGRLHKGYMETTGQTILYASLMIQTNSAVCRDLLFDQPKEHLYVMTQSMLAKIPIFECSQFSDCKSCLAVKDPYCGWCVLQGKCSRRSECTRFHVKEQWLWGFHSAQQCLSILSLSPTSISREEQKNIFLTFSDLPALQNGESYSCFFGEYKSPAILMGSGIMCPSPEPNHAPSLNAETAVVFLFLGARGTQILDSSPFPSSATPSTTQSSLPIVATEPPKVSETPGTTSTPAPTTIPIIYTSLPATSALTTSKPETLTSTEAPLSTPSTVTLLETTRDSLTLPPTEMPTTATLGPTSEYLSSSQLEILSSTVHPTSGPTTDPEDGSTDSSTAVYSTPQPVLEGRTPFLEAESSSTPSSAPTSSLSPLTPNQTRSPSASTNVPPMDLGTEPPILELPYPTDLPKWLPPEDIAESQEEWMVSLPPENDTSSFSASILLSGGDSSESDISDFPRILNPLDYQYDAPGFWICWGPEACPCVTSIQGSSLMPVNVQKITLIGKNFHLYQARRWQRDQLWDYECALVLEGKTLSYSYSAPQLEFSVDIFVQRKRHLRVDSIKDLNVTLYNCSVGHLDCSRCQTADAKYSCVWCGGEHPNCLFQDSCKEEVADTCPAPLIHAKHQDIAETVTVAGIPCEVDALVYEIASSIVCTTGRSGTERSGHVVVEVPGGGQGISAHVFTYQNPELKFVSPVRGPKAGGTSLTLTGSKLLTGNPSRISIWVGHFPCYIHSEMQEHELLCQTSASNVSTEFSITVKYGDQERKLEHSFFKYTLDPNITYAEPAKSFQSGGREIRVHGHNLDVVQWPKVRVTISPLERRRRGLGRWRRIIPETGCLENALCSVQQVSETFLKNISLSLFQFEEPCQVNSSNLIVCKTPAIKPLSHSIQVKLEFVLDNLSFDFNAFHPSGFSYEVDPFLKPLNTDDITKPYRHKPGSIISVEVQMGNKNFWLGRVQYDTESQLTFPLEARIGLGVGTSFTEEQTGPEGLQKNLMTEMMDLTSDLVGTGIPFLDYKSYAERIFFPGHRESPLQRDLDVPESRRQTVEQGLVQLSNLLNSKLFLTKFIHTLEIQRTFSPRDRAYVASLLTVALHGKLEYFTDILKTLLNDLVEQYVAKNPKLMLRRTETVVEKLLTNWMSICLYAFVRDSVGEPLYMLFRGIKHQVDKGPVDWVTGKAKYTLNDNRLLREDLEYRTLTLTALSQAGNTGGGTEGSQGVLVKGLDCDTITQVKEKILDQLYKGTPYCHRPDPDSLDLEWRSGLAGHLILSDEDVTSIIQGSWKRLNTLQHYKVPDGATVALVPRMTKHLPRENQDYIPGEKTPMLEDADEGGMKLWHLVKSTEEPELPKHRRGSLRERERAKAIPEIYLTRLLSMKGTLQKFVDDLFQVILSTNRPVPLAVKYFFDLLDEQALNHGITDPETIHIWKTNRFWINIIKNPQFVFDVQTSDNVDACFLVPDGATVALVPRMTKHLPRENQDYIPGEKTPMLEDADEGGMKLWHLVKSTEEPELPKHRRGSLRERERAKAIPEIYLRLLSMKKFVDDLFQVILSTNRPVPLAVKYFFDLLDEQALNHGITDPETIHIWKTNSLPLRFWINIIKNPQFVFDVQTSDNVDAVLLVIAQTFMDSCTLADHKLGRDSPINKLLYARDIPRYKQMVERYYADIRQTISASDQEMNSALAELSRNYSGELNSLVALHELYKYINKYYDQIITALEEDPIAQKMQLGYRLQQIAAAVENKVTDL